MRQRLIPFVLTAIGVGGFAPPLLARMNASTLDTVVVTASRARETKREVASNVTVIDSEEIRASTAVTVADLVVQQGFQVITTGDESNVQIRGFGNGTMNTEAENTVLTLLNGRRIGMSNIALAGLANVERIEIIRGPSAVQYGSSAMGGVINIITKRGSEEPVASLELGLGSDRLMRERLVLSGAKNGFDFALGATNSKRGDVTVKDGVRWYGTEVHHNTSANLDLGYSLNKYHRVGINYNYADVESELSSGSGGIRPYATNTPARPVAEYNKRNKNAALVYTGSTRDKRFDWSANYSRGSNDQKYITSGYTTSVDNTLFNAQGSYNGSRTSVSAGVDYLKYENSQSNQSAKTSMEDIGIYVTGKLRFLEEQLIFSAGLRHDKYTSKGNYMSSKKDDHTGGSVGVSYLPLDWLKLRANYSEGFKMPAPRQIGGSLPYYNPNSSVSPEMSKTYEFGGDINWKWIDASLTWFHSDWKNKIIGVGTPSMALPYQFQNIKDATLAGLEGSLSADVGKAFQQNFTLRPYVNFTWMHTRKNKDPSQHITYHGRRNDTMPRTPEWMISYGVDYAHPAYKIKSRINANYYGSVLTTGYSLPGNPYINRPGGTVVNVSLEKEVAGGPGGRLTLRTEVNNLFDGANEMYWGYPGAGRNFYVGLRYDMK